MIFSDSWFIRDDSPEAGDTDIYNFLLTDTTTKSSIHPDSYTKTTSDPTWDLDGTKSWASWVKVHTELPE